MKREMRIGVKTAQLQVMEIFINENMKLGPKQQSSLRKNCKAAVLSKLGMECLSKDDTKTFDNIYRKYIGLKEKT